MMWYMWLLLGIWLGGAFVCSFTVKAINVETGKRASLVSWLGALTWPIALWLSQDDHVGR